MRIASKRLAGWMAAAALLCAPVVCGQEVGAPPTPPKPKTVEITPTQRPSACGRQDQFTAVAKDDAGKTIDVKPDILDRAAAGHRRSDADGMVIFRAAGVVTVGAVVAGKPGFATVTVGTPPRSRHRRWNRWLREEARCWRRLHA